MADYIFAICFTLIIEIVGIKDAMLFHKRRGAHVAARVKTLEPHIGRLAATSTLSDHELEVLACFQTVLVDALVALQKCTRGRVYRVLYYNDIKVELIEANDRINDCLADIGFLREPPPNINERQDDRVPEDLLVEKDNKREAVDSVRKLCQKGVFTEADVKHFKEEGRLMEQQKRELAALLGRKEEELEDAARSKANQEEYLVFQMVQMLGGMDLFGTASSSGQAEEPPKGLMCPGEEVGCDQQGSPMCSPHSIEVLGEVDLFGTASSSGQAEEPRQELMCPITRELMADPVLLVDTGHTYDRSALEHWFQRHSTCPLTKRETSKVLVSNLGIRSLCQEWEEKVKGGGPTTCVANPPSPLERAAVQAHPIANASLQAGKELTCNRKEPSGQLSSSKFSGVFRALLKATQTAVAPLRIASSMPADQHNARGGPLWRLVRDLGSNSVWVQKQAASALCEFASNNPDNKKAIAEAKGSLKALVRCLGSRSAGVQEQAAKALVSLSVIPENQKAIAGVEGSLPALVRCLGNSNIGVQKPAACALKNLAFVSDNQKAIARVEGSLQALVRCLESSSTEVQEYAAAALSNLAVDFENQKAIVGVEGSLPALVRCLGSGSAGVQEYAAGALLNLAIHSDNQKAIAKVEGSLPALVRCLGSGNAGVQKRAAWALNHLALNPENKKAIAGVEGSLPALVRCLESVSARVQEQAAATLRNLALNPDNKKAIVTLIEAEGPVKFLGSI